MSSERKAGLIQRVGKLYNLLDNRFPNHRSKQGVLDLPGLGREMGFSHETMYRAVRHDELKVNVAHTIIRFSHEKHPEKPIYWQDLAEFVLPELETYSDPLRLDAV